jgi:hypothetical protein
VRFSKIVPDALLRTAHNDQRIDLSLVVRPSQLAESRDRMTETLTLCLIAAVGLITGIWWRIYILIALTPLAWVVAYLAAPSQEYSIYATIGFVVVAGVILQIFYFIGIAIRSLSQMRRQRHRTFTLDSGDLSENRKAYDNSK